MHSKLLWAILTFVSIASVSCEKKKDTPVNLLEYPSYFPEQVYSFSKNTLSKEGFELGKKLFFDPILSKDLTVSCASCHPPSGFFADVGVAISPGVGGNKGIRNAPSIVNTIWNTSFMWDGGVNHIELSGLPALTDSNEMAETIPGILHKLNNNPDYRKRFQTVFEDTIVTDVHLFYALTQYVGSIISATSKYDKVQQGKATYLPEEEKGYLIFKEKCASCHVEPLFTDYSFRNNGLEPTKDLGRFRISSLEEDKSKFKVPTLRNVMQTAPYMHDGRFETMDEVIVHYTQGIASSSTLDPLLKNKIELSPQEVNDLKSFLNTLTDHDLVNNLYFKE